MSYDFEDLLGRIETVLKDNLSIALSQIEAEKGDAITLKTVSDDAYFMQSLDDSAANFDPFIVYGIQNIEAGTDNQYGSISERITIYIIIILADNGESEIVKRLFRYQKAFKKIFKANFTDKEISNKIKINSLEPVDFETLDSTSQFKAIGITLETYLA